MTKTTKKQKLKNQQKIQANVKRDVNILMSIRGEIDLRTKSASNKKPKFSRKEKHKSVYHKAVA